MRFIVIDGLDAAGKDTHARLIKKKYQKAGEKVIIRSHPTTDTFFGKSAKKALLDGGRLSKSKATFFYTLDVLHSLLNYYGKSDTVIFVRYLGGLAYFPEPLGQFIYKVLSKLFPTSDLMFLLDVEAEEAMKRLEKRKNTEIFENKKDLMRVKKRAKNIMKDWYIIDTSKPIEEAQKSIEEILDQEDRK